MRVIYTSKGMQKKLLGARYTLGALYISKNTVYLCPIFRSLVSLRKYMEAPFFETNETAVH
jgi:hypothetical protein